MSADHPALDELDARFAAIAAELRDGLERLRTGIDAFREASRRGAEEWHGRADSEADARLRDALDRLRRLEFAAAHVESSLAYATGAGGAPGEHDETREIAARVLQGLEADRQRLYREVHDGPAQVLTNALFEIEFLERVADRAPADVRAQLFAELASLREQFRASLDGIRATIFDLRPPALAQLGLSEAMRAYAAEFGSRHGLAIETDLRPGPTGLSSDHELAIYRVLQEALQNVHRHSAARHVRLGWTRAGARWNLTVTDDGIGFEVSAALARPQSYGLVTMRERADVIGASFEVRSAPGQGAAVTLSVAA